jgi:hypothetical protein
MADRIRFVLNDQPVELDSLLADDDRARLAAIIAASKAPRRAAPRAIAARAR